MHVVRDLDAASGGPSRSVPALARSQARLPGVRVSVLYRDRGRPTLATAGEAVEFISLPGFAAWRGCPLRSGRLANGAGGEHVIVHLQGLWDPLLHASARSARRLRLPYVVSTRGMLATWALKHKSWKKQWAWRAYQRRDLAGASALLATSAAEQRDIASLLPASRVALIPNGCDERPRQPTAGGSIELDETARWALAMGRLHPVKGYAELLEAWGELASAGWKLVIAGPDEGGYRAVLERLVAERGLAGRVQLIGEVNDAQKWALLARCELFIAPSHTENFGMAIAEALQAGLPVLTTTGTPWAELVSHGCGWWVSLAGDEFRQALAAATGADADELRRMGANGQGLIAENYVWDRIAQRTVALYRDILFGQGCR